MGFPEQPTNRRHCTPDRSPAPPDLDASTERRGSLYRQITNGGSWTAYLLLHILQCWRACALYEENQAIDMVLYCSGVMYKYCSCLGVFPIKHNAEGKYINNEIFNNIPHFIKNRSHANIIQDGFVAYEDKLIMCKI